MTTHRTENRVNREVCMVLSNSMSYDKLNFKPALESYSCASCTSQILWWHHTSKTSVVKGYGQIFFSTTLKQYMLYCLFSAVLKQILPVLSRQSGSAPKVRRLFLPAVAMCLFVRELVSQLLTKLPDRSQMKASEKSVRPLWYRAWMLHRTGQD